MIVEHASWRDGAVALAQSCKVHSSGVSTIAVDRRRSRLAVVGGNNGAISLMDARDLSKPPLAEVPSAPSRLLPGCSALDKPKRTNEEGKLGGHAGRVETAAWLPEDELLFVTGGDECVKIWDASAAQECVLNVEMHALVRGVAVTQAPKALAAAALTDATVRVIDLRIGRAVNTMQGHSAAVMCVSWGEKGSHQLFSGGHDGTVRAWDVRMGARSLFLCDPYARAENRPELKKAEVSEDEIQRRKNPFGARQARQVDLSEIRFEPYRPTMNKNAFLGSDKRSYSQGGQTFGTGSSQPADFLTRAPASPPRRAERDKIREDLWNGNAADRARNILEPKMREYDYEASVAHRGCVISLVFSPVAAREDSVENRLLSCGVDGKVRIWDASSGAPASRGPSTLEVESWTKAVPLQLAVAGYPEDVLFLPERERVSIRCLRTGELLCGLAAHTQEVHCVSSLPGQLFTGGNDGRLLKWRLELKNPEEDVICLD